MAADRRATILVAEHDDRVRALLIGLLEGDGHRVLEAPDGVRMIRLLVEEQVDAVVLDAGFDEDDGIALARELREELPGLPIAVIAGDGTRDVAVADAVLPKPFTLDDVRAAVQQLLSRGRTPNS